MIKTIFFFVHILVSLHTHEFGPACSFMPNQTCWCGATRPGSFVSEPCSIGPGCLVLHGHMLYGPIIEPKREPYLVIFGERWW